ncbi:hypothetical protein [Lagierella sp.]|uniref:DUF1659 domain-containing protein n=1 Tax=Lagierella sp. TaxID=2849657 RepID=UPI00261A785C|nr:hypothetical protein [Lagierella sp.]
MAMVKSVKLKLSFDVDNGEKILKKSKTIQNISQEATEDGLVEVAGKLYDLIDGTSGETTKIVESILA